MAVRTRCCDPMTWRTDPEKCIGAEWRNLDKPLVPTRRIRQSNIYESTGTLIPPSAPNTAIGICRNFLSTELSDHITHELDGHVLWEQPSISMFGKRIPIPRLQTAFTSGSGHAYAYSGNQVPAHASPPGVDRLRSILEELTGQVYDFVLVNRYDDGGHSISYHADDEPSILPGSTIASYSLGSTRRFMLRQANNKTGDKIEIPTGNNVLILMGGSCQKDFQHQVPKDKKTSSRRYNLTFRSLV